jgi:hypothetical protein
MVNIQSTLLTAPDLCENVSLAVLGLFGSEGISNTVSTQSDVYVFIYIYIYSLFVSSCGMNEEWKLSKVCYICQQIQ